MLQDMLMLAALFILRIGVPLLLVVGIGYTILEKVTGFKLNWSPRFVTAVGGVLALWAFAAIAIMLRLTSGLGAVTNLSDQFPLGMWIGFDVMAGAMLGGGAFFLAGLVYVFGLEHYRRFEMAPARAEFRRSLSQRLNLEALKYWIRTFLPVSWVRALRRWRERRYALPAAPKEGAS